VKTAVYETWNIDNQYTKLVRPRPAPPWRSWKRKSYFYNFSHGGTEAQRYSLWSIVIVHALPFFTSFPPTFRKYPTMGNFKFYYFLSSVPLCLCEIFIFFSNAIIESFFRDRILNHWTGLFVSKKKVATHPCLVLSRYGLDKGGHFSLRILKSIQR